MRVCTSDSVLAVDPRSSSLGSALAAFACFQAGAFAHSEAIFKMPLLSTDDMANSSVLTCVNRACNFVDESTAAPNESKKRDGRSESASNRLVLIRASRLEIRSVNLG